MTNAYDAVAYYSQPFPGCHPDRLAVLGRLNGVATAEPATCSVLDLGCGDAGNLLAVAQALPGARCVGVDGSREAIARGRALVDASGLPVELLEEDLTDPALAGRLGRFDYIFAHGVWSWTSEAARAALPGLMAGCLAPGGVAYVSYLALPGHRLFEAVRGILWRGARGLEDPEARMAAGLGRLAEIAELRGRTGLWGDLLTLELNRYSNMPPHLLIHDALDEGATPFALEDLAAVFAEAGLGYLGEVLPWTWWQEGVKDTGAERIERIAGADRVMSQQVFDEATGVGFKATALMHADDVTDAVWTRPAVLDLHLGLDDATEIDDDSPDRALFERLTHAPRPVRELAAEAGLDEAAAVDQALGLLSNRFALPYLDAPAGVTAVSDHPVVPPLARAQAREADKVATLRHETLALHHDLRRILLLLCDGTRTPAEIAGELAAAGRAGGLSEAEAADLERAAPQHLAELARAGLLLA